MRHAIFPHRLAVQSPGQATVYDTLAHQIGGVSHLQGGDSSLTFSSQHGTVSVRSVPVVHGQGGASSAAAPHVNFAQPQSHSPSSSHPPSQSQSQAHVQHQPHLQPHAQPRVEPRGEDAWPSHAASGGGAAGAPGAYGGDMIALIEQLARRRDAGVVTEEEFNGKKRELLTRL